MKNDLMGNRENPGSREKLNKTTTNILKYIKNYTIGVVLIRNNRLTSLCTSQCGYEDNINEYI